MTYPSHSDPFRGARRPTREVRIGGLGVGAANPIRVQSMTTADTRDVCATVDEAERLVDAGCEIVRITAPSIREAENLREIKAELYRRGVHVPLVADIHFTPNAAMIAAEIVDKVRVNPGNFADKKKFEVREYSDAEYAEQLARVADRFRPLVRRCKERGVAMRVGTNHGSLSDRIMNRYGDTPLGMVESALEFLDVCEQEDYRDVLFSMKSSNAQVSIRAYRLLAMRLAERDPGRPSYPFHVGVTEAGDGMDGRVKSAIGIGALLEDGIGDTIRVSLTEDPVREIPVATMLARRAEARWAQAAEGVHTLGDAKLRAAASLLLDPDRYTRRETKAVSLGGLTVGGGEPVRVELDLGALPEDAAALAARVATSFASLADVACEGLLVHAEEEAGLARFAAFAAALRELGVALPLALQISLELASFVPEGPARIVLPVVTGGGEEDLCQAIAALAGAGYSIECHLRGALADLPGLVDLALRAASAAGASVRAISVESDHAPHAARLVAARLQTCGASDIPILLRHHAQGFDEKSSLDAAIDLGAPLCDGIGDAVSLSVAGDPAAAVDLAYRILQGARLRTTRSEYISCPSCGRTQFDLEETTARIKKKTRHLKGVKIAVMGCIVNGPGEMADADFGYVGSGPGRVTLYVGKEIVARNISEDRAPERLVELIRERGRWSEAS